MSLRLKAGTLFAILLASACAKDVKQEPIAQQIVVSPFASPVIPTPNDLALANAASVPGLQGELLKSFIARGGFPSDQAPALTVPLSAFTYDAANIRYVPAAAPTIDASTVTPQTFALFQQTASGPVRVDTEPLPQDQQVAGSIQVVKKADATGSRRLAPGRYVFAVRGGPSGVKTKDGVQIGADQAIALVTPNKNLTISENQPRGGLPPATVALLEQIRAFLWNPVDWGTVTTPQGPVWAPCIPTASGPAPCQPQPGLVPAFSAIDAAFPHDQVASIATFEIAPATTVTPLTDATSGQVPLPSDFLLDGSRPVPGTNNTRFFVRNVPAFGAAAAGLATLDGFSTTGLMLVPLTGGQVPTAPGAVRADTINQNTVFLFELPAGQNPRLMKPAKVSADNSGAEYLLQPPTLNRTQGGVPVTTVIGLQPAVAVPSQNVPLALLPPLKEKARYLVVVTKGVLDAAGQPIRRSTLADLLFTFTNALVDQNGKSQIPGVSDADAKALQGVRTSLSPVLDNIGPLTGSSLTKDDVVMAYTVQTQTITDTSIKLSALPYDPNGDGNPADNVAFTAGAPTPFDPASVGIDAATQATQFPDVDSFIVAPFATVDAIDPATGAFRPDPTKWVATGLPALVAIPKVPSTCTKSSPCPLPLVIWHHGLPGSKYQMLTDVNSLAKRGFVVAAIDSPYEGDRAFCAKNSDCTTDGTADGVCTPDQAKAGQGDAVPPGTCTTGHLRGNDPANDLRTVASANYLVSANFFRIRDGFRQDVLDQSALVLALARPPAPFPQPAANGVTAALLAKGIAVNPTAVYLEGVSIGGMLGTQIVATNPRFARAALDSAGGTTVDIFTTAPAFAPDVGPLFASLIPGFTPDKVNPGSATFDPVIAARYAQVLILAKWILDPADPINYAANVKTKLPSPLTASLGPTAHGTTDAFGGLGKCDPKVPNATTVVNGVPLPYGDLLYGLAGIPSVLYAGSSGDGCLPHAVIEDTFNEVAGKGPVLGGKIRDNAAEFLLNLTVPTGPVLLP